MESSKKLEWKKIEIVRELEDKSSSMKKERIVLDNFLLCFSKRPEIFVFDLVNAEWSRIIPKNSDSIKFCYTDFYIVDQSALIALEEKIDQYYHHIGTRLHSLTIDKTQAPWQMELQTSTNIENFLKRYFHTTQYYQKNIYIFGGKEGEVMKDDLVIFNTKTCTYLQTSPKIRPKKRYDHSSLIHNEKLFIYGGTTENFVYLNDIWAWNLKEHSNWECIFSNERFTNGLVPAPSSFSLMQGFDDTIFILQKYQENSSDTLLSFNMDSSSWEDHNISENIIPSNGRFDTFVLYNNKFIIGKNFDLYEIDLFYKGSLISKSRRENHVIHDYKKLFFARQFCDITFKVEGEEIPAHKAILAQRSDYFMNMFTSKMLESQGQIIEVPEIKCIVFKALLEFLYCGSTNITEEIALNLFKLSDEYQLEELKEDCEKFIMYNIRPNSVIDIFLVADKLEAFKMRKAALQYIIANIQAINEVDKISRLSDSVLCELIDRKSD